MKRPGRPSEKDAPLVEVGTYIQMCAHPYSRSKILRFVPRFYVINNLDFPLVLKEKGFKD